eukprot:GHVP01005275.1.p3 GENE.GHVP01005275.1~~GHVP01005275.1.p3  ORF type:complete len:123 (+),score=21.34 GHVP01005275.1:1625-1993(+)
MGKFKVGHIKPLELHNESFYFLERITIGNDFTIEKIVIDPKDYKINHEIVGNMDSIEINQETELSVRLCDRASYFLDKIKPSRGIGLLEMDIKSPGIDIGEIKAMKRMGGMKIGVLGCTIKQ